MASSKVILTGPWPNTAPDIMASVMQPSSVLRAFSTTELTDSCLKGFLRLREGIRVSRDPNIERWQNENAQCQVGNQASHDDNRKWALRVRSDGVRQRCRQ